MVLSIFVIPVFSQENAADIWTPIDESTITPQKAGPPQRSVTVLPTNPILYNNGPLVTHPGGGFGGADVSALQTDILMNIFGFGNQVLNNYWMADDFTVPAGGWNIGGLGFFGYQTGSTTISTMTAVHLMIYDGPPDLPASNVIFGDGITNYMTSSDFTNIYRDLITSLTANNRPIMLNSCLFNLYLPAGTYWVSWSVDGTLASGPWVPPVTVLGQTGSGNSLQYTTVWAIAVDSGTGTPQEMPFVVYGQEAEVPISNWAILTGIGLILAFAVIRFRRMA